MSRHSSVPWIQDRINGEEAAKRRLTEDQISSVVKLRADVLHIALEIEALDEVPARRRVREARHLADRLKQVVSAHSLVEACKRERQPEP
jgi:hypothetical protein